MNLVLAHMTALDVVRSVVDQPLLVGAAGLVVVLAILLVFVMVLRSGSRRDVGIGLDGRQEPYGLPRARPSQPNPYGQAAYSAPQNGRGSWDQDAGRMSSFGQGSGSGWDAAYQNPPQSAPMPPSWNGSAAPASGEPPWSANQQAAPWQSQGAWGAIQPGSQPAGAWEAGAAAAPNSAPWSQGGGSNGWGGAPVPASGQEYAAPQAVGQSQPFGQGFNQGYNQSFGQGQGDGYNQGFGQGYSQGYSQGGPSGRGFEAPGQGPSPQGGGWSAPASPSVPQGQSAMPFRGGSTGPRASRAALVVQQGRDPGHVYDVNEDRTTIGRSRDSDIFLEDLAVSRNHTSITLDPQGRYILRDEGSANGTLVNNQPVTGPVVLQFGDTVQVGQTIMTFSRR